MESVMSHSQLQTIGIFRQFWYRWCALGFHDADGYRSKSTKVVSCFVNVFTLLYFVLSVSVLDVGPVQISLYVIAIVATLIAQGVFVLRKSNVLMVHVTAVSSVLLGPLIAVDVRAVGAFALYRGIWYIPQVLWTEMIPAMGGSTLLSWTLIAVNSISFVVILIVESTMIPLSNWGCVALNVVNGTIDASALADNSQGTLIGMPFIGILFTMSVHGIVTLKQYAGNHSSAMEGSTLDAEIVLEMSASSIADGKSRTESLASYSTMDSGVRTVASTTTTPMVQITTTAETIVPVLDANVLSLSVLQNPMTDNAFIRESTTEALPMFVASDSSDSDSRKSSRASHNSLRSTNSASVSASIFVPGVTAIFYQPCVFVVVDSKYLTQELMAKSIATPKPVIDKYATYVHRCVGAYGGCMLWMSGMEVAIQFAEGNMIQSAVGFAHNLMDLCSKNPMLKITIAMSQGEILGSRVLVQDHRKTSKTAPSPRGNPINPQRSLLQFGACPMLDKCREVNHVLTDANLILGCDDSLINQFPPECVRLVDYKHGVCCHELTVPTVEGENKIRDDRFMLTEVRSGTSIISPADNVKRQSGGGRKSSSSSSGRMSFSTFAIQPLNVSSQGYIPQNAFLPSPRSSAGEGRLIDFVMSSSHRKSIKFERSKSVSKYLKSRSSRMTMNNLPPNFPPEAWELWLKFDTDRSGELSAEEIWTFFHRLGLKITTERFFDFLEHVDTDGSCTISMQEFADAYDGFLAGFVLMSKLRKWGETLSAQGADPGQIALDGWQEVIGKRQFADAFNTGEILALLEIDATEQQIKLMISELDDDNSGKLHMNDLMAFFLPEMSAEDIAKVERMESVTRVAAASNSKLYETEAQSKQREEEARARQYDFYVALVMIPYILYGVVEATLASGLWFHKEVGESVFDRSVAACVLDIIPLVWACSKFWVPREISGRYVVNRSEVRQDYLWSLEMLVDIIGTVPLEAIATSTNEEQEHDPLFRLHKLVLLYYLNTFYTRVTSSWNSSLSRIVQTFLWWVLCIHMFACVFLSLCPLEYTYDIITISDFQSNHTTAALMYTQSFDWAIKSMVGLNRGAPIPKSDAYVGLTLAVVIIGVVVFSAIVTTISNALNVRDASALFADKIEETRTFFEEARVSQEMTQDVILYYRHMFNTYGTTQPTHNPMVDIPSDLDIRVSISYTGIWFSNVTVLQPLMMHPASVYELNRIVRPVVLLPGEYASRQGNAILSLYVVSHGTLFRFVPGGFHTLRRGAAINEYGLLHNVKALHDVRVSPTEHANLFEITKLDFSNVMSMFPELHPRIRDCVSVLVDCMSSQGIVEGFTQSGRDLDVFFKQHETKETSTSMHHSVCEKLKHVGQ